MTMRERIAAERVALAGGGATEKGGRKEWISILWQ
jgi:hypothetical protein